MVRSLKIFEINIVRVHTVLTYLEVVLRDRKVTKTYFIQSGKMRENKNNRHICVIYLKVFGHVF